LSHSLDKTAWDILESDFKQAFVDCAKQGSAHNEMKGLTMKNGLVDEYIASFKNLRHRASVDLNDPSSLRMFH